MRIVVDTGVLLAAADTDDTDHNRCAALLRKHRGELHVPAPVIPETSWQIERNLNPRSEAAFLRLITGGHLHVADLTLADWARCVELIETYADLGLGLVDASVIAIAERLNLTTIATLNRRDFNVVRPSHTEAFDLIP
ncbi:MAG: type II toxin-antitoxin system VapC family toxin [Acidimicrobiales bacterium]